jgi:hypothetical protein
MNNKYQTTNVDWEVVSEKEQKNDFKTSKIISHKDSGTNGIRLWKSSNEKFTLTQTLNANGVELSEKQNTFFIKNVIKGFKSMKILYRMKKMPNKKHKFSMKKLNKKIKRHINDNWTRYTKNKNLGFLCISKEFRSFGVIISFEDGKLDEIDPGHTFVFSLDRGEKYLLKTDYTEDFTKSGVEVTKSEFTSVSKIDTKKVYQINLESKLLIFGDNDLKISEDPSHNLCYSNLGKAFETNYTNSHLLLNKKEEFFLDHIIVFEAQESFN